MLIFFVCKRTVFVHQELRDFVKMTLTRVSSHWLWLECSQVAIFPNVTGVRVTKNRVLSRVESLTRVTLSLVSNDFKWVDSFCDSTLTELEEISHGSDLEMSQYLDTTCEISRKFMHIFTGILLKCFFLSPDALFSWFSCCENKLSLLISHTCFTVGFLILLQVVQSWMMFNHNDVTSNLVFWEIFFDVWCSCYKFDVASDFLPVSISFLISCKIVQLFAC